MASLCAQYKTEFGSVPRMDLLLQTLWILRFWSNLRKCSHWIFWNLEKRVSLSFYQFFFQIFWNILINVSKEHLIIKDKKAAMAWINLITLYISPPIEGIVEFNFIQNIAAFLFFIIENPRLGDDVFYSTFNNFNKLPFLPSISNKRNLPMTVRLARWLMVSKMVDGPDAFNQNFREKNSMFLLLDFLWCALQRNWPLILVNVTRIRLYLSFTDWFWIERNSVWLQTNQKMINTIWFR